MLQFDRDRTQVQLHWRSSDNRARIFFATTDRNGRQRHYCALLQSLKVIRDRSSLQLCRVTLDGTYVLWARLNFLLYERMVLFYCTFVAMKYQDSRLISTHLLHDHLELLQEDGGEVALFGGQIRDGDRLSGRLLSHAMLLILIGYNVKQTIRLV